MKFIGIKILESATLMTRAAYCSIRGWEVPKDENPDEEVYLVEYQATEKNSANVEGYMGYVSMSPKDVFEAAYTPYETFYDKLLFKTRELAKELNALNVFMGTQGFADLDRENKDLLYSQSRLMNEYLQVLGKRLEILGQKFQFKK